MNARRLDLLKPRKDKGETTEAQVAKRLNKSNVMCQLHFEASQFSNTSCKRRRLIRTALPTLFNISNPPKPLTLKRKTPTSRLDPPPKPKREEMEKKNEEKSVSPDKGAYCFYI